MNLWRFDSKLELIILKIHGPSIRMVVWSDTRIGIPYNSTEGTAYYSLLIYGAPGDHLVRLPSDSPLLVMLRKVFDLLPVALVFFKDLAIVIHASSRSWWWDWDVRCILRLFNYCCKLLSSRCLKKKQDIWVWLPAYWRTNHPYPASWFSKSRFRALVSI